MFGTGAPAPRAGLIGEARSCRSVDFSWSSAVVQAKSPVQEMSIDFPSDLSACAMSAVMRLSVTGTLGSELVASVGRLQDADGYRTAGPVSSCTRISGTAA
jgi:hypothetical protein